jgi:hypothetical protein
LAPVPAPFSASCSCSSLILLSLLLSFPPFHASLLSSCSSSSSSLAVPAPLLAFLHVSPSTGIPSPALLALCSCCVSQPPRPASLLIFCPCSSHSLLFLPLKTSCSSLNLRTSSSEVANCSNSFISYPSTLFLLLSSFSYSPSLMVCSNHLPSHPFPSVFFTFLNLLSSFFLSSFSALLLLILILCTGGVYYVLYRAY